MRHQLRHLMNVGDHGKTTIQVVPYSSGARAGTTGFVILDFPEPTDPGGGVRRSPAGDIYLEERADVSRYTPAIVGRRQQRCTLMTPCI